MPIFDLRLLVEHMPGCVVNFASLLPAAAVADFELFVRSVTVRVNLWLNPHFDFLSSGDDKVEQLYNL
ncbi:MAG: hypothetical protein DMF03_13045 [Verrucomicrobia bacterium]|nr:MAG: hypothetical protein DMF03_13045 [Verrucomicrobiota bacterium]